MSTGKVAIIIAGHVEQFHIAKKLSIFNTIISPASEPKHHKGLITEDIVKNASSIWFFQPKNDIKPEEAGVIETFMQNGGAVVVSATSLPPGLSAFIKKHGIIINEDVISPAYISYVDPRHVTIQNGIVNRSIAEFANDQKATFAFPNGRDLELIPPAVPLLASGLSSYPLNRPVVGYSVVGRNSGSLTVFGSAQMFTDEWIRKESNEKLVNFFIGLIITREQAINQIDADHPEITERWYTPDVQSMSEKLRSCIQEGEKLRSDFPQNFERGLFNMDMSFVADVQNLAQTLGLKNDPLETVKPQFDTALPPLTPAVFPPQMREPPGPVLELFDLDDAFASPKTRLAQLAQRTPPKNAEKFIIQAAKILGILPKLPEAKQDAKHVLEFVFTQVVRWKRQTQ
ncbi:hypothetical protein TRFO_30076 [Tritrichomonas foetus]|uniref:Uncharacterized protein n=1 Tax=Tritrichomonas foetus TaxID=1144522 RepID=A0A1J4JZN5_9EUKA|nr:hypothetical protein TRFO_30076 [Tritrichomonas foetus]|eukprot:OHT02717.1 hypothetical protein TRFO_30076 [Tritrichomonas foetus]